MLGSHSSASEFVILARGFLHSPCKILVPPSSVCTAECTFLATRACAYVAVGEVVVRQCGVMYCAVCSFAEPERNVRVLLDRMTVTAPQGPLTYRQILGRRGPTWLRASVSVGSVKLSLAPPKGLLRLRRGAGRPGATGDAHGASSEPVANDVSSSTHKSYECNRAGKA